MAHLLLALHSTMSSTTQDNASSEQLEASLQALGSMAFSSRHGQSYRPPQQDSQLGLSSRREVPHTRFRQSARPATPHHLGVQGL